LESLCFNFISRIFNPDVFGSLPPNHVSSREVEFVVRQLEEDHVQLYNIAKKEVASASKVSIRDLFLFGGFNPSTTV